MTNIKFDSLGFALESGFLETHDADFDGVYIGKNKTTYVTKGFGLPAGSYLDAPNVKERTNEVVVRKNNGWTVTPDFRGQVFYVKESGEPVVINQVGLISDDLTSKEKPDQFSRWDIKKNNWVIDRLLKQEFVIAQNGVKKHTLKTEAEERIILLERKVKLKRATEDDLVMLNLLYGFTLDLDILDLNQENIDWIEIPK